MAVAALVLGIIGTLSTITVWGVWLGLPLSVVALVLGVLGRKQAVNQQQPTGVATAGLVLGIIGTALGALIFAMCASCFAAVGSGMKQAEKELQKAQAEQKAHQQPSGPAAKIGESVVFGGDSTWVVTTARDRGKKIAAAGEHATTDGRFVEVTMKITNNGQKEDSILDLPALVDAQGREFKPWERSSSFLPAGGRDLAMAPLPPSLPKEFVEIYEVPADAGALKFKARALAAFGDTRFVDLGL
jgi:hypothetical protein